MFGNKFFFILFFSFFIFSQAKFMKKQENYIPQVPNEITVKILSYLDYQNFVKLCRLNHQWRDFILGEIKKRVTFLNNKLRLHTKSFTKEQLENKKQKKITWLHIFALHANSDLVKDLIEFIINRAILNRKNPIPILRKYINQKDIDGRYTLHLVMTSKTDVKNKLILLLKYGAQINSRDLKGNTPLHFAVDYRQVEAVKIMLLNGADALAVNDEGEIPENYVCYPNSCPECCPGKIICKKHKEIESLLLSNHCENFAQDLSNDFEELHLKSTEEVKKKTNENSTPNNKPKDRGSRISPL